MPTDPLYRPQFKSHDLKASGVKSGRDLSHRQKCDSIDLEHLLTVNRQGWKGADGFRTRTGESRGLRLRSKCPDVLTHMPGIP